MAVDKELWIDLHTLVSCSSINNGFVEIVYQYTDDEPPRLDSGITYRLRVALRAVGFKITKLTRTYTFCDKLVMEIYSTNIPDALWSFKEYNEWMDEVEADEHVSND